MTAVVLLGAGASKEAGVPTTAEMTKQMVEGIGKAGLAEYTGVAAALNFVVGAIIAHDAARGASPYDGLDVERVFSAVELLATRDELEVAPFVSAWHPAVDSAGPAGVSLPGSFARDLRRAILESSFDHDVDRTFTSGVEAVLRNRSSAVYQRLMDELTRQLTTLAHIQNPSRTRYLSPLFELAADQRDITLATLNYDRSVEQCGDLLGAAVTTGISEWIDKGRLPKGGGIHLLKLHGFIDWWFEPVYGKDGYLPHTSLHVGDRGTPQRSPAVVFGQRGKLRANGPFLDLLADFDRALASADHLLVVGYSFRDDHVNEYITRWLNADLGHHLIVIDPGFPAHAGFAPDRPDFRRDLLINLSAHDYAMQKWPSRLHVDRRPASLALPDVVERLKRGQCPNCSATSST